MQKATDTDAYTLNYTATRTLFSVNSYFAQVTFTRSGTGSEHVEIFKLVPTMPQDDRCHVFALTSVLVPFKSFRNGGLFRREISSLNFDTTLGNLFLSFAAVDVKFAKMAALFA